MAEAIRLKQENVLTVEIEDAKGNKTGDTLVFDLEDIETLLKYQESLELHKKNLSYLKSQYTIIDKRQDVKGKKLLSKNEEDKYKALKEFYTREMSALDLFLGENGCKKLLCGRNPYYTMFDDISEELQQILPELEKSANNIKDKIIQKYSSEEKNEI